MDVLHWLLLHVDWANLIAAVLAFGSGLIIYFLWSPPVFAQHPFTLWAFWALIGQWIVYILIYIIRLRFPQCHACLVAALDLESLLTVGFSWVFLQGDDFKWRNTCGTLFLILVSLSLWNLGLSPASGLSPLTWLAPSEALSAFAMQLFGFAFFVRYRVFAFPLFFISVAYAACQQPVYAATLGGATNLDVSPYLLALAFGKLILAGLAYGLFFAPVQRYVSATPELEDHTRDAIKDAVLRSLKWTFGTVITGVIVAALAGIIAKHFVK